MNDLAHQVSPARSWIIIVLLVLLVLAKGLYAFGVIGDFGMPSWNYGAVEDVPAQSPYAEYELLPHPQHVRGARGK